MSNKTRRLSTRLMEQPRRCGQTAADLFRPVYERTAGVDGWGSLEVSPLLAHSTQATITEAQRLRSRLTP